MASARSIVARDDTLLGVCFALGQDLGFNPLYLRIGFAAVLFWSPTAAFVGYAALGALVALSRWLYPDPAPAEDVTTEADELAEEPRELPLAA